MSEGVPKEREVNAASEPLDREWFNEFKEAGGALDAYEYFEGTKEYRDLERKKFDTGEIENPTLDYPKLDAEKLNQRDDALVALKEKIIGEEFPGDEKMEMVQQVYRWKINEKLAEVRMLKAAASGDMRRFQRYSEFVYGKPSEEIFAYTVEALRKQMEIYRQSENIPLREAAADLDNSLPKNLGEYKITSLPNKETFNFARDVTLKELGYIIDLPADQEAFDAQGIEGAFQAAITQAKIEGWKTIIDPNRTAISVSQEKKTAFIPEKRNVTRDKLEGLVLHEIGTHAVRRDRGERSRLMLLGLGLDRYKDDEGVTGLREQILSDEVKDFTGLDGHLASSLASGVDGIKRDFRGVYEIMKKHFLVENLASGKDKETAEKSAATQAWNRAVRTFRGTDCKTPGVSFNKDLLYREGNVAVWEVVRTNPNEMMRFNVGKYDPANPRHIMILDQLGITDADLAALEK